MQIQAILVVLSVLALIVGFGALSQATLGIGILAAGCMFAILARIAQAAAQHRELMASLGTESTRTATIAGSLQT